MNKKKHNYQHSHSGFTWRFSYLFILTYSLFFLSSCKKNETIPAGSVPTSFNYFPVDSGRYVIYNVDSTVHGTNDNNTDDSIYYFHFQLKDVVDTPFVDGEGLTRQVVLRYYRSDTLSSWVLRNVWSQLLTTKSAYRYEDNIAYHKLAFPINLNITWNGNDMNTLGDEDYSYESIHVPLSYNTLNFDSTITVLQIDQDDYVEEIYGTEVYANGVGLVYQELDNLTKTIGLVTAGTEYKMTVAGYGKE